MKCDAAGRISTRQDPLGIGVEARSENGPLGFGIRYGEYDPNHESPSLGCTVRTAQCVAIKCPSKVEDSSCQGRCSCSVHRLDRSTPLGNE